MLKIARLSLAVMLTLIFCLVISAQTKQVPIIVEPQQTGNCDYLLSILDAFASRIPTKKRIILVSFQGDNEPGAVHVRKRLRDLVSHFTNYYKDKSRSRTSDRFLLTIGIDKSPVGKVDFYVDGELELRLLFRRNADPSLPPCYR